MRSALPLKFDGYCGNCLGTKYTQNDYSADLVKVCKGTLRLVKLYPDGHGEGGRKTTRNKVCRSHDGFREHVERREDDSASSDSKLDMQERAWLLPRLPLPYRKKALRMKRAVLGKRASTTTGWKNH